MVQSEVMNRPNTMRKSPTMSSSRKYPASYRVPEKTPTNIKRAPWMEPIHEMSDDEWELRRSVS